MKIDLVHASYDNCTIKLTKYISGDPALLIMKDGMPLMRASVIIEDIALEDNYILIKNWSENTGILQFLTANNIVEDTGDTIATGFCEANVCKLLVTEESLKEINKGNK
jgi:hypothetical protein